MVDTAVDAGGDAVIDAVTDKRLGVTVLVGFLGSGKTTLLNQLLGAQHGRKMAVIVNDFAELNIDAALVKHADARLVELSNGCICCTLREDLHAELVALAEVSGLEGVIIESTGVGEPLPIAQTFYTDELLERVRLDNIVSVVDAARFWTDFTRTDTIEDAEGNPLESPLAPLLLEQLEFTNTILLNKCDQADPELLARLEGFVRTINPSAELYHTEYGVIDPALILDTGRYDYAAGPAAETWDLDGLAGVQASGEADEYGFVSWVYHAAAPLRWQAFVELFEAWPDAVIRAKGFVAFADHAPVLLSVAGEDVRLEQLELQAEATDSPTSATAMADTPASDTLTLTTDLVLIGRNLPQAELQRMFDGCRIDSVTANVLA